MQTYVIGIALSLVVCAGSVRAEPLPVPTRPVQITKSSEVTISGGFRLELPAGFVLVPPDWWTATDAEVRRLQNAETRLKAENKSLRKSIREAGTPWYWIGGAIVTGFAAGVAYEKLR